VLARHAIRATRQKFGSIALLRSSATKRHNRPKNNVEGYDMRTLFPKIYGSMMLLACVSMLAAFAAIMLGVVARELHWDIQGLDAYAGYSIAAALFLALPGTLQHGDHIRVSLLIQRSPAWLQNVLEYWALLAGLAIAVFMTWYAGRLVWVSYTTHDVSPAADATPLWIPQLTMVIGCAGFALAMLHALTARIHSEPFFAENTSANVE
jgi:TRAP-type C4-dicarboxylate transport system permease small subunit